MSPDRLSPLDASFLAVEDATSHMHVGWAAFLDPPESGPRPAFDALAGHIAKRLAGARRWRQRLVPVPLGVHEPVWEDDPEFDARRHLHFSAGGDLGVLAEQVLSVPLPRDRPLWDMWIAPELDDGRIGIVGKAHHCMVDGIAALELTAVVLDRKPAPPESGEHADAGPAADGAPGPSARLAQALGARAAECAALAALPVRLAVRPAALLRMGSAVTRAALPPAPAGGMTGPSSPERRLVCATRPVDDLRTVKRRYGTSINDALLAACAGALRAFALRRGDRPAPLKAMIPVDVRGEGDGPGNRITFVYLTLPCDEPDPVERLRRIGRASAEQKRRGDAEGTGAALQALALAPRPLQRAAARLMASPRMFSVVVSIIPGPRLPVYLAGCRVRAIHPAVPIAAGHALSVGVCTVGGDACFGFYADRVALPDAEDLAADLDGAVDELLHAG